MPEAYCAHCHKATEAYYANLFRLQCPACGSACRPLAATLLPSKEVQSSGVGFRRPSPDRVRSAIHLLD